MIPAADQLLELGRWWREPADRCPATLHPITQQGTHIQPLPLPLPALPSRGSCTEVLAAVVPHQLPAVAWLQVGSQRGEGPPHPGAQIPQGGGSKAFTGGEEGLCHRGPVLCSCRGGGRASAGGDPDAISEAQPHLIDQPADLHLRRPVRRLGRRHPNRWAGGAAGGCHLRGGGRASPCRPALRRSSHGRARARSGCADVGPGRCGWPCWGMTGGMIA